MKYCDLIGTVIIVAVTQVLSLIVTTPSCLTFGSGYARLRLHLMLYLPLDSHVELYFIQTGSSSLSNTYNVNGFVPTTLSLKDKTYYACLFSNENFTLHIHTGYCEEHYLPPYIAF